MYPNNTGNFNNSPVYYNNGPVYHNCSVYYNTYPVYYDPRFNTPPTHPKQSRSKQILMTMVNGVTGVLVSGLVGGALVS
ncbi:hypothetical protein PG985_011361 [Apiospora marii]|uniref:Uncharacterized protein n=1 Tax=Apiospora marii TaxID=335849 RepID=A0ABR1STG3_9PEZI